MVLVGFRVQAQGLGFRGTQTSFENSNSGHNRSLSRGPGLQGLVFLGATFCETLFWSPGRVDGFNNCGFRALALEA